MLLEAPLIVLGEYGTPKALFASYVAKHLGLDLLTFWADEKSTPKDLLYDFDQAKYLSQRETAPTVDKAMFVRWQALGYAIKKEERSVVVVEGFEQTTTEFQLGLFHLLDAMAFNCEELGISFHAASRPIVIVLNELQEGRFPESRVLRRAIAVEMPPPSREEVFGLLRNRIPTVPEDFANATTDLFFHIRTAAAEMRLRPSIADLFQWLGAILTLLPPAEALRAATLTRDGIEAIPHWRLLIRDPRDVEVVDRALK
jgi:MoxR-like ATPase